MDDFSSALNHILVEVYRNVIRLEELALRKDNRINLSINEMHLIESVGEEGETGISVGELAEKMKIKRPSATVAVKKLERKGYVRKIECQNDGRVVWVCLTDEGKKIDAYHKYYHRSMVKEISEGFSEEEKDCLIKAIYKLNHFFKKSIGENR